MTYTASPQEKTVNMLRAYYSWTAEGNNPTTYTTGREYADGTPVRVIVHTSPGHVNLSDDGVVAERFAHTQGINLADPTVDRMMRLFCTSWGVDYRPDGALQCGGPDTDLHHHVAGFADALLAVDGLRVGLSGKVRLTTPDKKVDGKTTIRVQRSCNGCGESVGDVTQKELGCAMSGAPLPDVTEECGCPNTSHPVAS